MARLMDFIGAVLALKRRQPEPRPTFSPALQHWILGRDNDTTQSIAMRRQPLRAVGRAHAGFHPDREDD